MRGGANKEKGRQALAWISFGLAVVAGAAAAGTFIGGMIAGVVGFFPGWVGALLCAGLIIGIAIDVFIDSEPNRVALFGMMLLPSLARAVPGQLGDTVTNAATTLLVQVQSALGQWLGLTTAVGIALGSAAIALLMARRVIAKTPGAR
jgi:hypothetical protein